MCHSGLEDYIICGKGERERERQREGKGECEGKDERR